jgi:hypothetical protein
LVCLAVSAAGVAWPDRSVAAGAIMSTTLLPFQPETMTPAQQAAVSYLARYRGHIHALYTYQLSRWFAWCESSDIDPLVGVQRAHDRARGNLDRHGVHFLTAYVAGV